MRVLHAPPMAGMEGTTALRAYSFLLRDHKWQSIWGLGGRQGGVEVRARLGVRARKGRCKGMSRGGCMHGDVHHRVCSQSRPYAVSGGSILRYDPS